MKYSGGGARSVSGQGGTKTTQADLQVVISVLSQEIGYLNSPDKGLNFKSFLFFWLRTPFTLALLELSEALQKPADSSGRRNQSAFQPLKVWTKLDKTLSKH